ncbi:hypothetical protein PPL_05262 [Heterostelium album PN500]|uniref:Uncharacterized protein n=1 Tax=Heterostelium pallidum (strain ATCC 26659 / Pp 5 / PN500) TaxID=670386 RepID=D3BB76_HETP5|nr:hypothetical protein PPL_05262 [Heterostelium album PN500]EFA81283.1 hypothetical protein PPL_05262 [Heterostelium album PN500]|eukprot:XP_020433401.1 hypothetical protein PPL_05262 [Heterostelium album PN500]
MSNSKFEENYVLSSDNNERLTHLNTLIAGSVDYYYYNCLHLLNVDPSLADKSNKSRFDQLLKDWTNDPSAFDYSLHNEISNRALLLGYTKDNSNAVFESLKNQLSLQFHYAPTSATTGGGDSNSNNNAPTYPSKLDESKVDKKAIVKHMLETYPNELRFERNAIPYVVNNYKLTAQQIKAALGLVSYPVYDNIVEYILQSDLRSNSSLFNNLTLAHLDKLSSSKPDLVDARFITLYINKLLPSQEVVSDWKSESALGEQTFKTVYAYVNKLPATFNSAKMNVLHHYLQFQIKQQNHYDLEKFKQYCQLPRSTWYYIETTTATSQPANLAQFSKDYLHETIPTITRDEDEELLKKFFRKIFQTEKSIDDYLKYFRPTFLKPLFAEVKLLANQGELEKWYQLLDHTAVQELKERVDILFDPANPTYFHPDDAVIIKCAIKNVQHLLVKVFEINTYNYYKAEQKQLDTAIKLDGLVANQEYTFAYTEPPIQSVERSFDFPTLKGRRGLFVIEFIGNGKSSRAIIKKGGYNYLSAVNQNGQLIHVLDEDSVKITKCSVTIDGNVYKSDEKGDITVPFSANAGHTNIILTADDFSTFDSFNRKSETYKLDGGIYLENSTFIQGEKAPIVVRGKLYLNGTQISISNLEDTILTITTTDSSEQKIVTTKEVKPFPLSDKEESSYLFKVPENVGKVAVKFQARVKDLSGAANYKDLSFQNETPINSINETDQITNIHLSYAKDGYKLNVIGKGGERVANKQVSVAITHVISRQDINEMLQSDKDGIIHLGQLHDVESIIVYAETSFTFVIGNRLLNRYPSTIYSKSGDTITIPYFGNESTVTRSAFNLYEVRRGYVVSDLLSQVHLDKENKEIQISKLAPGLYYLIVYGPYSLIQIEVCDGDIKEGFIVNSSRALSYHSSLVHGLNVNASTAADKKNLEISVRNASPSTRVHVISSYFVAKPTTDSLSCGATPTLQQNFAKVDSSYFSGRALGDEITYILNRKLAKNTLPGNSLKKPSLLLQPWSVGKTTQQKESLKEAADYRSVAPMQRFASNAAPIARMTSQTHSYSSYLEFLNSPSTVILNLVPDAKGNIVVPLSQLSGSGQLVQITAVDNEKVVSREVVIDHTDASFKDTSLIRSLDAQAHFTEKKLITTVPAGQEFTISNADSAKFTIYDTLSKFLSLVKTIAPSDQLQDFSFVVDWESLSQEQKNEKFSKFYCHELAFFIYKKDKKFFEQVVKPFVSSKMHKTFMDNYLSGDYERLVKYLTSSVEFNRLNVVEKILLAEVFPEHAKNIETSIVDAVQYNPLAPIRYDKLFKIALSLDALDEDDISDLREYGSDEKEEEDDDDDLENDEYMAEESEGFSSSDHKKSKSKKMVLGGVGGGARNRMMPMAMAAESVDCTPNYMRSAAPPGAMSFASLAPAPVPPSYGESAMMEKRRVAPAPIYKEIEKTEEWAETYYYKVNYNDPQIVSSNEFWRDYVQYIVAQHNNNNNENDNQQPFLSRYITLPTGFTASLFALSVLDLPFSTKDKDSIRNRDGKVSFTPTSSVIVFHQELVRAPLNADSNVLVSQHFFDPANRYSYESNEQNEIYVSQEFLTSKVYGALVVVANLSSKQKKLDVLLQIAKGSVPIGPNPFYTRGESIELSPYSTHSFEYFFYFPKTGQFPHFPAHISEKDKIISSVEPFTFNVVSSPTIVNQLSWEYIANHGTNQAILEYINKENINRISIHHLYPKLTNYEFWKQVVELLKSKKHFDYTVWSFTIFHKDSHYCQDFLNNSFGSIPVGDVIVSPLLTSHPLERGDFSYLEYSPLVNARTHQLGEKRTILNDKLSQQYKKFCKLLTYTVNPSDRDLLSLVYYLLTQDRYEETVKIMKRVGTSPEVAIPLSPALPSPAISEALEFPPKLGDNDKKRKMSAEEKQQEKEEKKREKERIKEEKKKEKEDKKREKEERKKKEDEEKKLRKLAKKSKTDASPSTPTQEVAHGISSVSISLSTTADDDAATSSTECIDVHEFNEPSCLPDLQVQYDYLISYLDFFNAAPTKAKEIAEKYKNFPVQRWNALFRDLYNKIQQVNDNATDAMEVVESENDRDRRHAKLVSTEPSFDVNLEANRTISVNYSNLSDISVSYYIMDIELLFSTNPFVQQEMGQFLYISPNKKESFPLQEKNGSFVINIPEEFKNSNIVVDCHSAGIHHNLTVYSNNIAVQITEKAGQLRVIERQTKKPIAKAYIKVYEKNKSSGNVQFWKDGYSDIAGYFDYSSVSTGNINEVSKFSILVLHNQFGALIKEAKPPAN